MFSAAGDKAVGDAVARAVTVLHAESPDNAIKTLRADLALVATHHDELEDTMCAEAIAGEMERHIFAAGYIDYELPTDAVRPSADWPREV